MHVHQAANMLLHVATFLEELNPRLLDCGNTLFDCLLMRSVIRTVGDILS